MTSAAMYEQYLTVDGRSDIRRRDTSAARQTVSRGWESSMDMHFSLSWPGCVVDTLTYGPWQPLIIKAQTFAHLEVRMRI